MPNLKQNKVFNTPLFNWLFYLDLDCEVAAPIVASCDEIAAGINLDWCPCESVGLGSEIVNSTTYESSAAVHVI